MHHALEVHRFEVATEEGFIFVEGSCSEAETARSAKPPLNGLSSALVLRRVDRA